MFKRALVLAGTRHGRNYCNRLAAEGKGVIASVRGSTASAGDDYHCPVRIGGFGGVNGLIEYIHRQHIDRIVDKTHRFAHNISANARLACERTGIIYEYAKLPAWPKPHTNAWQSFSSLPELIHTLKREPPQNLFLALGAKEARQYAELVPYHQIHVRSIMSVQIPNANIIFARGPFSEEDERRLFTVNNIDKLVCRNSGEALSLSKVNAALSLSLPIYMLESTE